MADSYLERIAGEIADLALADEHESHDENIVAVVGEMLGSSSQTLQEAFLTAVRVRRAEARAREFLQERANKRAPAEARLLQGDDKSPDPVAVPSEVIAMGSAAAPQASGDDTAFADVLDRLDAFVKSTDDPESDTNQAQGVTPERPTR